LTPAPRRVDLRSVTTGTAPARVASGGDAAHTPQPRLLRTGKARRTSAFQPPPAAPTPAEAPRARMIAFVLEQLREEPTIGARELTRRLKAWNAGGTRSPDECPSGMANIDARYVAKLLDRVRRAQRETRRTRRNPNAVGRPSRPLAYTRPGRRRERTRARGLPR
jgi:hypothetical protein